MHPRGPIRHGRRSLRLKAHDYARAGTYFVTINASRRACLFGEVFDGEMRLNAVGRLVVEELWRTHQFRREVELDAFVVMPNHLHAIVVIREEEEGDLPAAAVGAHGRAPLQRSPRSLGALIAGFKASTTRRVNEIRGTPGARLWQRNYYEHVVRDDEDLNRIRTYIGDNPLRWDLDPENPSARRG